MSPTVERKLAAIPSADVVGYSRLMAEFQWRESAGSITSSTSENEDVLNAFPRSYMHSFSNGPCKLIATGIDAR